MFLLNMTQIFFIYKKKYFSSQMHQSGQNIFKLKLNQTFSIQKEQNIIYRQNIFEPIQTKYFQTELKQ